MSDPINYHPHSRFTLHEKAGLFPFKDLIWNKTDGPFVDLKVDFPDPANHYADGTAYLRVEDVIEIAHCLGMATREEIEALKKENAELKAKLLQLPTKVESFKNELSGVTSNFLSSLAASVSPLVAGPEEPKDSEPNNDPAQPSLFDEVPEDNAGAIKRAKRDHPSAGKPDESAKQSGNESPVSKGPNELSGSDGNSADPLADFFGIRKD